MGGFLQDTFDTGNSYKVKEPDLISQSGYFSTAPGETAANIGQLYGQQQGLSNQLLAQSQGQGPNPALEQLNETTGQNIRQNTGMIASQKGVNPALAARLASENAGQMNQQAAGHAATMRAQQQLGAQKNLGGLYGQMANQQQNYASMLQQAMDAYNNRKIQASLGTQQLNANLESQNASNRNQMLGAAFSGGGSYMMGAGGAGYGGNIGGGGGGGGGSSISGGSAGGGGAAAGASTGAESAAEMAYKGGEIKKMFSGGDVIKLLPLLFASKGGVAPEHSTKHKAIGTPKSFALQYLKNGMNLKSGGHVPGSAKVKGDSEKNDTQAALLSPGEIVIPRHIAKGENAPEMAAKFVKAILAKKRG